MKDKPLVSIVLPVYNGETTVKDCLLSLLEQTYTNIEIIVLNDGSTDKTNEIVTNLKKTDNRIIYIEKKNEGLIKTLNRGIELCNGGLIARMDADDICEIERISDQVDFMLNNPGVGLVGPSILEFGERSPVVKFETDPLKLKILLLFQNEFAHPSVMIRRNILIENNLRYEDEFLHVEDLALWNKISRVSQISNLNQILLKYRVTSGSVSAQANKKLEERNNMHKRIYKDNFHFYDIDFTEDELNLHRAIVGYSPFYFDSKGQIRNLTNWLKKLYGKISRKDTFDKKALQEVFIYQNFIALNKCSAIGMYTFYYYLFKSPFKVYGGFLQNVKFFVKCLMKYKPKNAEGFNNFL